MGKKVLLMYITEVSGHHQATKAIEKALRTLDPTVETMRVNGFNFAYPIMEKIVNKAYLGIIKRMPKIWDYLYDNPKIVRRTQSFKEAIHKAKHKKFDKLFEQFRPDVVICTQAFPCGMVADYKLTHQLETKIIGVLTDHAPHAFWLHDGVDCYVVPSKEAKDQFCAKGIEEERIHFLGIPIDLTFTKECEKDKIIKHLGLHADRPVVLIMGGGQGLGPIKTVVQSLCRLEDEIQMIVVAGTNRKLIKWLKKAKRTSAKPIVIFDYANNIHELMDIATLIVTKPGGLTTAESLAKGLPLVIVRPIPGQEMRNTEFFLRQGVAIHINNIKSIGSEISHLLRDSKRLDQMRRAAFENSRPEAAIDIARLALNK